VSTEAQQIKALLIGRVEELARTLVPDGSRQGHYWIGRNPTRADKLPGSFWIALRRPCAWRDEATDEQGDLLSLIGYVTGEAEFGKILAWARKFLGVGDLDAEQYRKRAAVAVVQQQEQAFEDQARLADDRRRAFGIYLAARKRPFAGSPAEIYLTQRGIAIAGLKRMPQALGWLPDVFHPDGDQRWPVMVAGLSDASGAIVAVHRTWLAPDGMGKAPVRPVRKIWPSYRGCAVRLWRGESGMSVAAAERAGHRDTLVLVEGIEDGLSVALAMPGYRIWCVGALGNFAAIVVPRCCRDVIVCVDNDWGNPQARNTIDRGLAALSRQGVDVRVARSPVGKDVNDALIGMG
jgi:Toprim domain